jgi:3-oxoacyl-[acyl-carrier-protein] synthase II
MFLASFKRLGVIAPEGVGCRPFDRDRRGFLLSEAAAAMCLQAVTMEPAGEDVAVARDNRLPLSSLRGSQNTLADAVEMSAARQRMSPASEAARHRREMLLIDRYAIGGDATHLTGGDATGAALRHLLAYVIDGRGVDLIQAHGTGTIVNDPIELAALDDSVNRRFPPPVLFSHKGALGHSLGAAGMVSLVLNAHAHRSGCVPPNIHTTRPLVSQRLVLTDRQESRQIRRSIALAAGFGGPLAVVSIRTAS